MKKDEKRIYLLRHGKTEGFARKSYVGGMTDIALSEEGERQAWAWRRYFEKRPIETVYSSGMKRTTETARIVSGKRLAEILIENDLREICLGDWEGWAMETVRERFPEAWRLRGENLKGFRPPGGESFSDLAYRVVPAFEKIVEKTVKEVLIVAHAGVNRVILADIMGVDLNDVLKIPQDYAALNTLELSGGRVIVSEINQTLAWQSPIDK